MTLARRVFRKLPPQLQDRLRTVRSRVTRIIGLAPQTPPVLSLPALPQAITLSRFQELAAIYDQIPMQAREAAELAAFDHVSLNPECCRLLHSQYAMQKFRDHSLFQQMIAAYDLGCGRNDAAFSRLAAQERDRPSAFRSLLAARCLLRPPGRERDAIRYLQDRVKTFDSDLHLVANYAAALFAVGQTDDANRALAPVVEKFKAAVPADQRAKFTAAAEGLKAAIAGKRTDAVAFHDDAYDAGNTAAMWEAYENLMTGNPPHLLFGWMNSFLRDKLSSLVSGNATVVNFGVMCAQTDYETALRHPQARFVGVDIHEETAAQNRLAYSSAGNMEFHAAEIEDILPRLVKPGQDAVLFHARTATLLYPERVRRLYRLCASLGVRQIALFENHSLSHGYYRFFDFADMPAESIIYKNYQFIHNYPALLEDAGYRITAVEKVLSPLITPHWTMELGSTHVFLTARLG